MSVKGITAIATKVREMQITEMKSKPQFWNEGIFEISENIVHPWKNGISILNCVLVEV
jgi:hypothetical protein